MTKQFLSLLMMLSVFFINAQVAIGKQNVSNASVSLEFGTANRGIILPYVEKESVIAFTSSPILKKGGTLILDSFDKKVKISKNDGSFLDLSIHTNEKVATGNKTIDNNIQKTTEHPELTNAKVVIADRSKINDIKNDDTPGILVLADTNKAMILPKVNNPELNILSPAAGMVVYDPAKKTFCVFNGTVWSYWSY